MAKNIDFSLAGATGSTAWYSERPLTTRLKREKPTIWYKRWAAGLQRVRHTSYTADHTHEMLRCFSNKHPQCYLLPPPPPPPAEPNGVVSGDVGSSSNGVEGRSVAGAGGALSVLRITAPFWPTTSKRLLARSCHCFSPVTSYTQRCIRRLESYPTTCIAIQ